MTRQNPSLNDLLDRFLDAQAESKRLGQNAFIGDPAKGTWRRNPDFPQAAFDAAHEKSQKAWEALSRKWGKSPVSLSTAVIRRHGERFAA